MSIPGFKKTFRRRFPQIKGCEFPEVYVKSIIFRFSLTLADLKILLSLRKLRRNNLKCIDQGVKTFGMLFKKFEILIYFNFGKFIH
jgi:hypothetical protein